MIVSGPLCWVAAQLCLTAAVFPPPVKQVEPVAAVSRTAHLYEFDIAAQPMPAALAAFRSATAVQILYADAAVAGLRSARVRGSMSALLALEAMVAGTPLQVIQIGADTFVLRRRPPEPAPVKPAASDARWLDDGHAPAPRGLTVTGAHLRDLLPLGPGALTLGRDDIQRTGLTTLHEVSVTVPRFFGGGPTEDTVLGLEALTNSARGSALNLRGLGAGSTLVLFNGRRLATGGSEGAFVDVAALPLSAIARIEVLGIGASPSHGADAAGGVVNLVPRWEPHGGESLVRAGSATHGAQEEFQIAQTLGLQWDRGAAMLALDVLERGALHAADRSLARSDLRSHGGDDFDTLHGNPGTIVQDGVHYAIPRLQDGRGLMPEALTAGSEHRYDLRGDTDLLPRQQRTSGLAAVKHDFTESLSGSLDLLLTRRALSAVLPGARAFLNVPGTNPFHVDPAGSGQPVLVAYGFDADLGPQRQHGTVEQLLAAAGLRWNLSHGWRLDAHLTQAGEDQQVHQTGVLDFEALATALADPDPRTAFNPFGDGSHTHPATLAAIEARRRFATRSRLRSLELEADGPAFRLSGGEGRLAVGAAVRHQTFTSANLTVSPRATSGSESRYERTARALFAELQLPFVGAANARNGLARLEMSLGARLESHEDFARRAVPALAMLWSPRNDLAVRAGWARSYRAPGLADLDETHNGSQIVRLVDPLAPDAGPQPMLVWFGRNAHLRAESAAARSVGVELAPRVRPGLTLSATYFDIELSDRVQEVVSGFPDLANAAIAPFIERSVQADHRRQICERSAFLGTSADCILSPVAALIDLRVQNIASTRTRGVDLAARQSWDTAHGTLELAVDATRMLEFSQAFARNGPRFELGNTQNNPLDLQLRASAAWRHRSFGALLAMNHAGSYTDTASEPQRRVDSWTTYDFQAWYEPAAVEGWLSGTGVTLSIRNLLDDQPPFLNNPLGIGYDQENGDLTGRFASLQVRKRW